MQYHNIVFSCASLLLEFILPYDISLTAITFRWNLSKGTFIVPRIRMQAATHVLLYKVREVLAITTLKFMLPNLKRKLDFHIFRTKLPAVNVLFMDSLNITI